MSGLTDIITGSVADGFTHQFEWWFVGFSVGMIIGLGGLLVRFVLLAGRNASNHEI